MDDFKWYFVVLVAAQLLQQEPVVFEVFGGEVMVDLEDVS